MGEEIRAAIADVNAPIELSAEFGPVEMLLVSREQVHSNNLDSWNSPAVYLLISRRKGGDAWAYSAYVGQSAHTVSRLKAHVKQKKDWHRACVIRKAGTGTFSSSQIAWLEGRIWSLISTSEHGVVANSVKPGDDTLQPSAVAQLENLIPPITNMLRLAQVDITPAQDTQASTQGKIGTKRRNRTTYTGNLDDLLNNGLIVDGHPSQRPSFQLSEIVQEFRLAVNTTQHHQLPRIKCEAHLSTAGFTGKSKERTELSKT